MAKSIWATDAKTETLLEAARAGDDDAVNALLEKHRVPVRRLVELRLDRKVRRRVDISDVVQEVMVEASNRLERYLADPSMAFHLWLRHIARDRIIDTYRRHRGSAKRSIDREQPIAPASQPDQSSLEFAAQLCDPQLTPATAAAHRELAEKVEAAIERMNDADGEIILMRHYEHLSNSEIAESLGINPPAASKRYLRAVKRLRELLEESGITRSGTTDESQPPKGSSE